MTAPRERYSRGRGLFNRVGQQYLVCVPLAISLKTAQALRLTIPQTLLFEGNWVIQ